MAQKRMLSKSISLSQQVASMSFKSQFIFTWCIPHLDDFGLIENRAQILKAMVFPMNRFIRPADIELFIDEAEREGLIEVFEDCLEFSGFENHQSISPEKKSKSKFSKVPLNTPRIPKNPQESPVQIRLGEDRLGEESIDIATQDVAGNEINEIITLFKEVNPTFERLFSNKTQRSAVSRLLKKFGKEKMVGMLGALPSIISKKYAPKITTPLELERDLGKLIAFVNQDKQPSNHKVKTIV